MNENIVTFGIATKITTTKRRDYLYKCIDSILTLANTNFKIVISDDNSNIDVDWLQYENEPRIKIFHQKQSLGIFKNFNFCLNKTTTKWFIPMGDDDIINLSFLDVIYDIIEKDKEIEIVYFNHENIDGEGNVYCDHVSTMIEGYHYYQYHKNIDSVSLLWSSPASFFSVISTEKIKSLGGFPDYGMTTDGYLAFLYFLNFKGYLTTEYIAKLRRHSENASGSSNVIEFMNERTNLINLLIKDFGDKLNSNVIASLMLEIENIKYSHINGMKKFRDVGRIQGGLFFIDCIKHKKFTFKSFIISLLGIIFGKHIQYGFNILSKVGEYIKSKVKAFNY